MGYSLRAWLWNRRGEAAVLLISSIWVLALTFPLILRLTSSLYATGWNTDNPGGGWTVGVWSTWWTKQAWASGQDWRVVPIIGAPFGVDWRTAPLQYLSVYVTTALATITGELAAHNLSILASFPLSALTAYWLAFELTHSRRAALVGGLAYAFSTYHWARASVHFNMAMIQWVPLYLLALFRWSDRPSPKRAVGLGAAFALVLLDNYYYGYFMVFVTAAFLAGRGLWAVVVDHVRQVSRARIVSGGAAVMSAALIVLPFVTPFVGGLVGSRAGEQATTPWLHSRQVVEAYGAQPWMFLVPSGAHPLWRPWLTDFYRQNFRLNEQALYLGLVALGLGAWGWWRSRGEPIDRRLERDKVTVTLILVVMIWTASPPLITIGPVTLPTPSYFLADALPMFRAYARIGGLATIAAAVLAAIGVLRLIRRWPARRNAITLIAASAILFDFLYLPPVNNLDLSQTPAEYTWLAEQPGDFIIAEYPLYPSDAYARMARYLFYQRVHHKRMFNGAAVGSEGDVIRQQIVNVTDPSVPGVLNKLGVRYVMIHMDFYGATDIPAAVDGPPPDMDRLPVGLSPVAHFGSTWVYEVARGDD